MATIGGIHGWLAGRALPLSVLALLALLAADVAAARIQRVDGPVAANITSVPYGAAMVAGSPQSVDLAAARYVEEEFFVSGAADVYGRDARDALVVVRRGVPYVTRVLVRRPADPARFSGVVHLEPLHPQFGTTTTWPGTAPYIMRSGDAHVAIGVGADANTRDLGARRGVAVAAPLVARAFDPERYAVLEWPEEDGIRWDVIRDVVGALRGSARQRLLPGAGVRRVFASGWSFSGSLWRTWINEGFHARAARAGAQIDGYLIGISSRWNGGGYLALNSASEPLPVSHPRRALASIDAPVIELLTEFEVAAGSGPQLEDRDAPRGGHRLYELGGNIHGDGFTSRRGGQAGRTVYAQLAARGYPLALGAPDVHRPQSCALQVADTPIAPLTAAALRNLREWVDEGRAPPRAAPLALDTTRKVRRDPSGNPLGGLRIAEFEVPWASYGPYAGNDRPECASAGPRPVFFRLPMPAERLVGTWGSRDAYLERYDAATDALVAGRWLLAEEAAELKARTRDDTARAFDVSRDAGPAPGFGRYRPAPRFDSQALESFYLTLRDGTRLAVAVARPARNGRAAEGRFPVIWHHTLTISRIDADGTGGQLSGYRRMPTLTEHGYVVVQVARRGNGQSFGARRGYHERNEAHDAFEITEWLARQPWSDGKVGIYGCSNTGEAAMHALTVPSPSLKAVFAGCFSWNKYDGIRRGGIFAQWGTGPTRSVEEDMKVPTVDGDGTKRLLRAAAEEHQLSTSLLDLWKAMPYRDSLSPVVHGRFWGEGSVASYAETIRRSAIPVYIQGGWYDEFRDHGVTAFMNLPGQARLVLGPWLHCENDDLDLLQEAHRFFDRHLKGVDTGIDADPPIHYFTVNAAPGTEWRTATRWPLPQAESRSFAFSGAGRLVEASVASRSSGSTTFAANYSVACPDAGEGSKIQPCHATGAGPSFASAPLPGPLEVTGDGVVRLWVSVDASDANLFAYLEDVAPDGKVSVVTEGRLKASLRARHLAPFATPPVPWHRSNAADAQPLVGGEPVLLEFGLLTTSWVFRPGHRLQVTVSGADHRERAREGPARPPRITIWHDTARRSSIELPVIAGRSTAR